MGEDVPVGDRSLRVDGDDRSAEVVLAAHHEALDLTSGGDCLHLSADVQQVVLDVLEHIHLRYNQLPDAVCLQ